MSSEIEHTSAPPSTGQTSAPSSAGTGSGGSGSSSSSAVRRALANKPIDVQMALLEPAAPVQKKGDDEGVHAAAAKGIASGGGALPHGERIQAAFGAHDVSNVQAHTGGAATEASQAMGAQAYATGNHVVFGGAPDLHTAAHEAAHVVQQQAGVSLAGGVGQAGDAYEQHADQVADAVTAGKSAEGLLSTMTGGAPVGGASVQRRIHRDVQRAPGGPGPGPLSGTGAGAGGGPLPGPVVDPPMTAAEAKGAIDAKIPSYADLSGACAATLTTVTRTEFDQVYDNNASLQHDVIKAFVSAGPARETTQAVGSADPIAVQKFQDIDQEAHLQDSSVKGLFYNDLATEMKNSLQDRTRTFPAMKTAAGYKYNFQGKPITPDRITPLSTRNQGIDGLYDIINSTTKAAIDAKIMDPLIAAGVDDASILTESYNVDRRKKAYAHMLATGTAVKDTIDLSKPVSPHGTWYHPGALVPSLDSDPDVAFTAMMTLGALQPEWYQYGTVVLDIDMTGVATRVCRKPTAFDGLMSALWVARNIGENDYGLTGGGAGEFLEANVPYANVTNFRAVIPSDAFQAELQALIAAAPKKSTPTEEALRNPGAPMTPGMGTLYGSVIDSTVDEQTNPSAAPVIPGAAAPRPGMNPTAPALASGGAYDRP